MVLIRFTRRLPKHFARNQMQRMPRFSSPQLISDDNRESTVLTPKDLRLRKDPKRSYLKSHFQTTLFSSLTLNTQQQKLNLAKKI